MQGHRDTGKDIVHWILTHTCACVFVIGMSHTHVEDVIAAKLQANRGYVLVLIIELLDLTCIHVCMYIIYVYAPVHVHPCTDVCTHIKFKNVP